MKLLQFFRHKKDSGGMSSYRVKEFIAVIRILIRNWDNFPDVFIVNFSVQTRKDVAKSIQENTIFCFEP